MHFYHYLFEKHVHPTKNTKLLFRKLNDFSSTLDLNIFQTFKKLYVKQTNKVNEEPTLLLIISLFLIIFMRIYKRVHQFQAECGKKKGKTYIKLKGKKPLFLCKPFIFSKEMQVLLLHHFLSQLATNKNTRSLTEAIPFLTWFKILFCSFTFYSSLVPNKA